MPKDQKNNFNKQEPTTIAFDSVKNDVDHNNANYACVIQSTMNYKPVDIMLCINKFGFVENSYIVHYGDEIKTPKPVAVLGVENSKFLTTGYYAGKDNVHLFDDASKNSVASVYYDSAPDKGKSKISLYEQEMLYKHALDCCDDTIKKFAIYAERDENTQKVIKKYLNDCMQAYKDMLEKQKEDLDAYESSTLKGQGTKEANINRSTHRIESIIPTLETTMRQYSGEMLFQYAETYRQKYERIKNDPSQSPAERLIAGEREKCMEYVEGYSKTSNGFIDKWESELLNVAISDDIRRENQLLIQNLSNPNKEGYDFISKRLASERSKLFEMEYAGKNTSDVDEYNKQKQFVNDLIGCVNGHPYLQDNNNFKSFNYQIHNELAQNHADTIKYINQKLSTSPDEKNVGLQLNIDSYNSTKELKQIKLFAQDQTIENKDDFIRLIDEQISKQSFKFAQNDSVMHISTLNVNRDLETADPAGGVFGVLSAKYDGVSQRDYYDYFRARSALINIMQDAESSSEIQNIFSDDKLTYEEKNDKYYKLIQEECELNNSIINNPYVVNQFINSPEFKSIMADPESIYMTTNIRGETKFLTINDENPDRPKLAVGKDKTLKPEYSVDWLKYDISTIEDSMLLNKAITKAHLIEEQYREPYELKTTSQLTFISEYIGINAANEKSMMRHAVYDGLCNQSKQISDSVIEYLNNNQDVSDIIAKLGFDVNQISSGNDKYSLIESLDKISKKNDTATFSKIQSTLIPALLEDANTQYHYTRGVDKLARNTDGSLDTSKSLEVDQKMANALDLSTALKNRNPEVESYLSVLNRVVENQNNRSAIIDQINNSLDGFSPDQLNKIKQLAISTSDPDKSLNEIIDIFGLNASESIKNIDQNFKMDFLRSSEFIHAFRELGATINTDASMKYSINLHKTNEASLLIDIYNDAVKLNPNFVEKHSIDDPSVLEYLKTQAAGSRKYKNLIENIEKFEDDNPYVEMLSFKLNEERLINSGNLTVKQFEDLKDIKNNIALKIAVQSSNDHCLSTYHAVKESFNAVLESKEQSAAMANDLKERREVLNKCIDKLANMVDNTRDIQSMPTIQLSTSVVIDNFVYDKQTDGQSYAYRIASSNASAVAERESLYNQIKNHSSYNKYCSSKHVHDLPSSIQEKSILPDEIAEIRNNLLSHGRSEAINYSTAKECASVIINEYTDKKSVTRDNVTVDDIIELQKHRIPSEMLQHVTTIKKALSDGEMSAAVKERDEAKTQYESDTGNNNLKLLYEQAEIKANQKESINKQIQDEYRNDTSFQNLLHKYRLINSVIIASRDIDMQIEAQHDSKIEAADVAKVLRSSSNETVRNFADKLSIVIDSKDEINTLINGLENNQNINIQEQKDKLITIGRYNESIDQMNKLNDTEKQSVKDLISSETGIDTSKLDDSFWNQLTTRIDTSNGTIDKYIEDAKVTSITNEQEKGAEIQPLDIKPKRQKSLLQNYESNNPNSKSFENLINKKQSFKDSDYSTIAIHISKNGIENINKNVDYKSVDFSKSDLTKLYKNSLLAIAKSDILFEKCKEYVQKLPEKDRNELNKIFEEVKIIKNNSFEL